MEIVCYPRFPEIDDGYYLTDLILRFNHNAKEKGSLSVPVHRQFLCNKSNYFKAKIQKCPVGQELIDISDIDGNLGRELIYFCYIDFMHIREKKAMELFYMHALKWNEESLLKMCLLHLELDAYRILKHFKRFSVNLRKHFFKNANITYYTVRNLIPLVAKRSVGSNQLMIRLKKYIADEVSYTEMHKLWKWCHLQNLDHLTQNIVDYATRLTKDPTIKMGFDRFIGIISLWIYMGNESMFCDTMRFLHDELFVNLDQFKEIVERWKIYDTFTASIAIGVYDHFFVIYKGQKLSFSEYRETFQQKILDSAYIFMEKDYIKDAKLLRYLKFLYTHESEKQEWIGPLKESITHYVQKNFYWPNGTPSRYKQLKIFLCYCKAGRLNFETWQKIANKIFLQHAINVLESLNKVDSVGERRKFYSYVNLLFPCIIELLDEISTVNFENLSVSTMMELYEHLSEIPFWLIRVGLPQAIYQKRDAFGLDDPEFFPLIRVLNDHAFCCAFFIQQKFIPGPDIQLSPKTLHKLHVKFGRVLLLANMIQIFLVNKLVQGDFHAKIFFDNLADLDYKPFDTLVIKWMKNNATTTLNNFELKVKIVKRYKLNCLQKFEKHFISIFVKISPMYHREVWREYFHTLYSHVARQRCVPVHKVMVLWLLNHLNKPCNKECKVTVYYDEIPYFYRTDINNEPSTLVETMVCQEVVKEPVEWYKAFVGVNYGNIRHQIESKLIDMEIASKDTLRELWEIADTNQRFAECPQLKASLEQRLQSSTNPAKRIKTK